MFKSIKPATRIGVSSQKYEIEKANLSKFGNNVKYLLDDMSSNYYIIIDKVEHHEYYVIHIFRALFSGPNSTCNRLIEIMKDDWDTVIEVSAEELVQNATEKYNNMVAEK